jgi:hypothetical protein
MRTLTWRTTVAHSMAGVATETAAMMTRAAPLAAQPVQVPKVAMELTMLRETTKHPTRLERTMMVLALGMGPAMMRLAKVMARLLTMARTVSMVTAPAGLRQLVTVQPLILPLGLRPLLQLTLRPPLDTPIRLAPGLRPLQLQMELLMPLPLPPLVMQGPSLRPPLPRWAPKRRHLLLRLALTLMMPMRRLLLLQLVRLLLRLVRRPLLARTLPMAMALLLLLLMAPLRLRLLLQLVLQRLTLGLRLPLPVIQLAVVRLPLLMLGLLLTLQLVLRPPPSSSLLVLPPQLALVSLPLLLMVPLRRLL